MKKMWRTKLNFSFEWWVWIGGGPYMSLYFSFCSVYFLSPGIKCCFVLYDFILSIPSDRHNPSFITAPSSYKEKIFITCISFFLILELPFSLYATILDSPSPDTWINNTFSPKCEHCCLFTDKFFVHQLPAQPG